MLGWLILAYTTVWRALAPPLAPGQVAFGYSRDKVLYSDVDLGVDLDSRVAIVGPNGAGEL